MINTPIRLLTEEKVELIFSIYCDFMEGKPEYAEMLNKFKTATALEEKNLLCIEFELLYKENKKK